MSQKYTAQKNFYNRVGSTYFWYLKILSPFMRNLNFYTNALTPHTFQISLPMPLCELFFIGSTNVMKKKELTSNLYGKFKSNTNFTIITLDKKSWKLEIIANRKQMTGILINIDIIISTNLLNSVIYFRFIKFEALAQVLYLVPVLIFQS